MQEVDKRVRSAIEWVKRFNLYDTRRRLYSSELMEEVLEVEDFEEYMEGDSMFNLDHAILLSSHYDMNSAVIIFGVEKPLFMSILVHHLRRKNFKIKNDVPTHFQLGMKAGKLDFREYGS